MVGIISIICIYIYICHKSPWNTHYGYIPPFNPGRAFSPSSSGANSQFSQRFFGIPKPPWLFNFPNFGDSSIRLSHTYTIHIPRKNPWFVGFWPVYPIHIPFISYENHYLPLLTILKHYYWFTTIYHYLPSLLPLLLAINPQRFQPGTAEISGRLELHHGRFGTAGWWDRRQPATGPGAGPWGVRGCEW